MLVVVEKCSLSWLAEVLEEVALNSKTTVCLLVCFSFVAGMEFQEGGPIGDSSGVSFGGDVTKVNSQSWRRYFLSTVSQRGVLW